MARNGPDVCHAVWEGGRRLVMHFFVGDTRDAEKAGGLVGALHSACF